MATDKTKTWESDEKFAALAAYRGAAAASGGAGADAAGGEGGEKKLSKNALKKLAKGKVCCFAACLVASCKHIL